MKYHTKTNRLIWYPYLGFAILMVLCLTDVLDAMIVGNSLTELGVIVNLVACGLLVTSASFLVRKYFQDKKNYEKTFITAFDEKGFRERARLFKSYRNSGSLRVKCYSESEKNIVFRQDQDNFQPYQLVVSFQPEGDKMRVLCKFKGGGKWANFLFWSFLVWLGLAITGAFLLTFLGETVYDLSSSLETALFCGLAIVPICNLCHGGSTWAWKNFSAFMEKHFLATEVGNDK